MRIPDQRLRIYHADVPKTWVDYNGHMGDFAYGIAFSNAATAYMDRIGIDQSYRKATAATLYTLDSRIGFLKECHEGKSISVELQLLAADVKRLHLLMILKDSDGIELALCEQVLMHVSRLGGEPRAAALPASAFKIVMADLAAHRTIGRPSWLEKRIGLTRA